MLKSNLKELRTKNGLTQKQVADSTDTTTTYISLLENGHKNPSDKMKEKLARLYRCHVEDIYSALRLTKC